METKWKPLVTIAIPVVGGTIAGYLANRSAQTKHQKFQTPKFAPPGWVFPIVWPSLYTLIGIAKYQYDKKPKSTKSQQTVNTIYATQLGLNYLWSFLFFRWNRRGTAIVDASLLAAVVATNTIVFYKESKLAGALMLPYLGWSTYAVSLNYAIWALNNKKNSI